MSKPAVDPSLNADSVTKATLAGLLGGVEAICGLQPMDQPKELIEWERQNREIAQRAGIDVPQGPGTLVRIAAWTAALKHALGT